MLGEEVNRSTADRIVEFLVAWLAAGKFVASLALLFGIGAALSLKRSEGDVNSAESALRRRYRWLAIIGLLHICLLFPGDILLLYGLTGLLLVRFVKNSATHKLKWGLGLILASFSVMVIAILAIPPQASGNEYVAAMRREAVFAYTQGSYGDIVMHHIGSLPFALSSALLQIPWILGLFLVGMALGGASLRDIERRNMWLRRGAVVGLGLGIPANGMLALWQHQQLSMPHDTNTQVMGAAAMIVCPLLAIGYLSGLTMLFNTWHYFGPLTAVGRMALSAYLFQSGAMLAAFAGLGLYDTVSPVESIPLVLAVWIFLLLCCPIWQRHFRFGPAEWAWRSLSYGSVQPFRRE